MGNRIPRLWPNGKKIIARNRHSQAVIKTNFYRGRAMTTIAETAADYLTLGWEPVRVRAGTKKPIGEEWQKQFAAPDAFDIHDNIGVLLQKQTDIDLDCPEAVLLAPSFLPTTGHVSGHESAPSSHFWYDCQASYACFRDTGDGKKKLLERRSGAGLQTVVPPSVVDGEPRIWYERGELAKV